MWPAETEVMDSSLCLLCGFQHVKLSDVSLGTRPPYGLVVDEGVKKLTKQIFVGCLPLLDHKKINMFIV